MPTKTIEIRDVTYRVYPIQEMISPTIKRGRVVKAMVIDCWGNTRHVHMVTHGPAAGCFEYSPDWAVSPLFFETTPTAPTNEPEVTDEDLSGFLDGLKGPDVDGLVATLYYLKSTV